MTSRLNIRIHILAIGLALLWQRQSTTVMAQKYYMNFAFNNNNPNGGEGPEGTNHEGDAGLALGSQEKGNGDEHPGTSSAQSNGDGIGSGGADGGSGSRGGSDKDSGSKGSNSHHGSADHSGSGSGRGSSGGSHGSGGSASGGHSGGNSGAGQGDDDDSDSHDPADRREKLEKAENQETGHSHHSSYEISIDDSFGGRYVRSIYESSEEEHGHEGSNAGSGSAALDHGAQDSSQSKQGGEGEGGGVANTFGDEDYEETN